MYPNGHWNWPELKLDRSLPISPPRLKILTAQKHGKSTLYGGGGGGGVSQALVQCPTQISTPKSCTRAFKQLQRLTLLQLYDQSPCPPPAPSPVRRPQKTSSDGSHAGQRRYRKAKHLVKLAPGEQLAKTNNLHFLPTKPKRLAPRTFVYSSSVCLSAAE